MAHSIVIHIKLFHIEKVNVFCLQMMHPYIIDTSVIFNLSGERHRKSKLALLSATFLNEFIQQSTKGHDSVEDSSASLKLVQLKLSRSKYQNNLYI